MDRATWARHVHEALKDDRMELHAQPIVELATGRTVQHELLIRFTQGMRECRQVLAFVEGELGAEPSRCREVVARLEAELQAHLRRYGTVRLPEINSPPAQPALVESTLPDKVELQ